MERLTHRELGGPRPRSLRVRNLPLKAQGCQLLHQDSLNEAIVSN